MNLRIPSKYYNTIYTCALVLFIILSDTSQTIYPKQELELYYFIGKLLLLLIMFYITFKEHKKLAYILVPFIIYEVIMFIRRLMCQYSTGWLHFICLVHMSFMLTYKYISLISK